uniref:C-type lectin domain-containing protein n=1 Tax=Globodera pallida TaxID=36090 RepID=A0A183CB95_GLOPA
MDNKNLNFVEGSSDFIDFLAEHGKRIIVLTNNATKSRAVYARKLSQLGFGRCITKHNIVNPAAVVADLLHRSGLGHGSDKKVYMIGGQGIKDEMDELDIDHFGDGLDPVDEQPASKGSAFLYELELEEKMERVGAVVVGYEKYFNYLKLMKAANYLRNEDCLFVATNEDETCPGPNPETVIPDAGPLVAAVRTASGRDPHVVGKPNTPAFDYICRRWTIDPRRTLMVGDRLNTDVKFGNDHGLRTMLVLSGCHGTPTTLHTFYAAVSACRPCLSVPVSSTPASWAPQTLQIWRSRLTVANTSQQQQQGGQMSLDIGYTRTDTMNALSELKHLRTQTCIDQNKIADLEIEVTMLRAKAEAKRIGDTRQKVAMEKAQLVPQLNELRDVQSRYQQLKKTSDEVNQRNAVLEASQRELEQNKRSLEAQLDAATKQLNSGTQSKEDILERYKKATAQLTDLDGIKLSTKYTSARNLARKFWDERNKFEQEKRELEVELKQKDKELVRKRALEVGSGSQSVNEQLAPRHRRSKIRNETKTTPINPAPFNSAFTNPDKVVKYSEAEKQCKSEGAELASVHNELEREYVNVIVLNEAKKTEFHCKKPGRAFFWFGMKLEWDGKKLKNASWTDGKPMDYLSPTEWGTEKRPVLLNNSGGGGYNKENENCVFFGQALRTVKEYLKLDTALGKQGLDVLWLDVNCEKPGDYWGPHGGVCKTKAKEEEGYGKGKYGDGGGGGGSADEEDALKKLIKYVTVGSGNFVYAEKNTYMLLLLKDLYGKQMSEKDKKKVCALYTSEYVKTKDEPKNAQGRDPQVVGKPNTPAFDYICRRWTIDPRRTLMVGDRLNTDVKFGNDHGLRTMLVLSGCHGVDDILDSQLQGRDDLLPDFYANSLGSLLLQVHSCANKKAATDTYECNTPPPVAGQEDEQCIPHQQSGQHLAWSAPTIGEAIDGSVLRVNQTLLSPSPVMSIAVTSVEPSADVEPSSSGDFVVQAEITAADVEPSSSGDSLDGFKEMDRSAEQASRTFRGALLVEIDVYICQTASDGEARDGRRQQLEQDETENEETKQEMEDAKKDMEEMEDAKKEMEQRMEDAKKEMEEMEDAKKEMEQRMEDAKCRMEQAKNRMEVKQQKANVEVAGTSCDVEPPRKKPKLGEADERVENEQIEVANSTTTNQQQQQQQQQQQLLLQHHANPNSSLLYPVFPAFCFNLTLLQAFQSQLQQYFPLRPQLPSSGANQKIDGLELYGGGLDPATLALLQQHHAVDAMALLQQQQHIQQQMMLYQQQQQLQQQDMAPESQLSGRAIRSNGKAAEKKNDAVPSSSSSSTTQQKRFTPY